MEMTCRSVVEASPSLANLDQYIQTVQQFPKLDPEEERQLAWKLKRHNDVTAAWKLVTSHLRYVVYIALDYRGYGLAMEDLIQEGNLGLMKAVKRFDPSRNVRLITYAVHWIRAQIHEFIQKNWRLVKVATTKARRKLFYRLRGQKPRLEWLSTQESEAIAQALGVRREDVQEVEAALYQSEVSLDVPADETSVSPAELLPDTDPGPDEVVGEWQIRERGSEVLARALDALDERSRQIIEARWLVEEEERCTLQELGARFGISAERVRQLERRAVSQLRQQVERELPAPGRAVTGGSGHGAAFSLQESGSR